MISDDMSEYFSNKNRVEELEKQVKLLIAGKSKWKRKYEKLYSKNPTIRVTRTSKARALVVNWLGGDKSLTFKEIAKKCFLTHQDIKNISLKLRKELNVVKAV